MSSDAPVIVARIARAHGIRGGLLLDLETDHAEALFQPGRCLLVFRGGAPSAPLTVRLARPHGVRWLLDVEEIVDRTRAEALRGCDLAVPRSELPDLEPEAVLLHDLVGARLLDGDAEVGPITDVYDLPGGPLLGVTVEGRERLVPWNRDLVDRIDLDAGEVRMRLPTGLLDI